jgi:hypothetical protein
MLGSTLPAIATNLTIDGSGQAITVDGANSFQILSVNPGATLTLQNLTLAHGHSDLSSGGIENQGTLTVTNSTLSGNSGRLSGGIFNQGLLTVTNGTFSSNSSTGDGGAIRNVLGTAMITNSTFSGNSASGGGGAIMNFITLTVTNSTFSANGAEFFAGGIGNFGANATMTVTNSTFSANSAGFGGGGVVNFFGATATLKGTILAAETFPNCGTSSALPVTDGGYNISDDNSCGFTMAPSGTSINNSTTLHLDPAGLENNGGPTETIALEPDSEAVDFIPVASCTDQSSPTPLPLTTDQRGLPRPDFGNPRFCDAGAFELQTTPIVVEANGERVQIARSTTPDSDKVNMAFSFIENASPTCDAADDAFNGVNVFLESGSCASFDHTSLELMLEPWVVHTVNKQSYGTIFQSMPPETVSARMVELPRPAPPACGEWTVNIQVTGVDSLPLGNGPFALILMNADGDQGCFDITNAIVGSQIPTPGHGVRRRVRR